MDQKRVGFTIDAGLIQRLGYELVGRAETAVNVFRSVEQPKTTRNTQA